MIQQNRHNIGNMSTNNAVASDSDQKSTTLCFFSLWWGILWGGSQWMFRDPVFWGSRVSGCTSTWCGSNVWSLPWRLHWRWREVLWYKFVYFVWWILNLYYFGCSHNKLQMSMSVKWIQLCVSKSATTLLEAMSANVKTGTSLWQELTSVQVLWTVD